MPPMSSSSMARPLLEDRDGIAFLDGLPFRHPDLADLARAGGLHRDLHLHGLQHDHRIAGGHGVTRLARDLEDHARDTGLDLFRHLRLLPPPSEYGCVPRETPRSP